MRVSMKKSYIKIIKPCFGKKDQFMKNKKCEMCQFRKRCLLLINNKTIHDVIN